MQTAPTYQKVYLIGIGGIGMSALARYFRHIGCEVAGYDRTSSALTAQLESEGMSIHFEDNMEAISPSFFEDKNDVLVIYTPAVPKAHKELNYFIDNGYAVKKRSEVLAMLTANKKTIAVAGTHGKTSTSALIVHMLETANVPFFGFLGGIAANYNTNFFSPASGEANLIVVEADEYDRSFLRLHPDIAIITAIESDHLDIYGTLEELQKAYYAFADLVSENGELILQENVPFPTGYKREMVRYGLSRKSACSASNIRVENGKYVFDANINGHILSNLNLSVPGYHTIENSLAAMAAVWELIEDKKTFYTAFESFRGVHRRFELVFDNGKTAYIDDYAHHPTEIATTIRTLRELYPGKHITGIFQPHLFSRTQDLAKEFAEQLSKLDEAILLPIYPAREEPIQGVTSAIILEKISIDNKKIMAKEELLEYISKNNFEVLATIGAGDIDRLVAPIKKSLEEQYLIKA